MATKEPFDCSDNDQANNPVGGHRIDLASQKDLAAASSVWWVNQGKTFSKGNTDLWAPLQDKGGNPQPSWTRLTEMKQGDVVVHCSGGAVRALSQVVSEAVQSTLPANHPDGDGQSLGWHVTVAPSEFDHPIPIKSIGNALLGLSLQDGPVDRRGSPKQGYLWRFNAEGLNILKQTAKDPWPKWAEAAVVPFPRVLKIAPGHEAKAWDDCLAGSYICVGWDNLGDLSRYATEAELKKQVRATYGDEYKQREAKISEKARELWLFRELQAGDLVVANKGISEVLAVGTVQPGGCERREERSEFKNTVPVKWDTTFARKIPPQQHWAFTTVEEVPPDLAQMIMSPPSSSNYDRLRQSLTKRGLHFSTETISDYLLALQSKRFVLLTGISGTGKTQLALAVAKHFQPIIEATKHTQPSDDAVRLEVFPYMRNQHRLVLRTEIVAAIRLPPFDPGRNGGQVVVTYPRGAETLSFYKDPIRATVELTLKGQFRSWFDDNLQVGDTFFVAVERGPEALADGLRFSLPTAKSVAEELLDNYCVIAVRPDWTDNRGLLGYYNPLTNKYSETPFLQFLLRARAEIARAAAEGRPPFPFFAILDEANLARVEHYFSDLLSCLESGEALHLHDDPAVEAGETDAETAIPRDLPIPENLFITGTVNVDETTYMFSPKVLDRAFTMEINHVDLAGYRKNVDSKQQELAGLALRALPSTLVVREKPDAKDWDAFGELLEGELRQTVVGLHELLSAEHRHFGYRVANEIARFVSLASAQAGSEPESLWAFLDLAILQKVLPKFHGTQQELEAVLKPLFAFAVAGKAAPPASDTGLGWDEWVAKGERIARASLVDGDPYSGPRLPRTATKLWRMLRRLRQQGFTSFIE